MTSIFCKTCNIRNYVIMLEHYKFYFIRPCKILQSGFFRLANLLIHCSASRIHFQKHRCAKRKIYNNNKSATKYEIKIIYMGCIIDIRNFYQWGNDGGGRIISDFWGSCFPTMCSKIVVLKIYIYIIEMNNLCTSIRVKKTSIMSNVSILSPSKDSQHYNH